MAVAPTGAALREATVTLNEPLAEGLYHLAFAAGDLGSLLAPGQFFHLYVEGCAEQSAPIPLSFIAVDGDGSIHTVYAVLGAGTAAMTRWQPGERVRVLGPSGHGWRIDGPLERVLLVSGGTGTVPVISVATELSRRGICFDAVVGARTKGLLWGLEAMERQTPGTVVGTTDDGSAGVGGTVMGPTRKLLDTQGYDLVIACGPDPMMAAVVAEAERRSVPSQVSLERTMACGFGACSVCAVRTRSGMRGACMQGPVFDGSEVVWA